MTPLRNMTEKERTTVLAVGRAILAEYGIKSSPDPIQGETNE